MQGYRVADAAGLVKLDAMENPYRLPEPLRAELGRRLSDVAINRYPASDYPALRRAIRERFGVPAGYDVLLGNGSDELITLLTLATARPGAVQLSPWPSFVMYELSARFAGSRFVGVPLAADFSLDLPVMLAAIDAHRPAIVWLSWPNNPTGNCFDPAAVERVLEAAPGLVVIDEAYQPFAIDSWLPRLPQYPNLAVLRTVSKLGLAGLRLGYLCAARPWLDELEKLRPPYNVNVLTEAAARFALEHLDVFEEQAARLRADREALARSIGELLAGLPGAQVFPSRANFLLVRLPDGPATFERLRARGVLVKDAGRMDPSLRNCLRLTVGTPEENRLLVEALRASV
ncbi:MAG: histidinol-phosphate transaminase [Burkholderiaceae bacterium]|nr:histidinol-phosphate transaminase [Burkholderiaceae bacterium]ODS97119.1 MAG: histidinol-phosphate transaminase [Lautropia sp. SCN 69-89]